MIVEVGLGAEVNLRAKAGFTKPSLGKPRSEEPEIAVFSVFASLLPFVIALLRAKSSYNTLKTVESY